jgi:hypothetical protein
MAPSHRLSLAFLAIAVVPVVLLLLLSQRQAPVELDAGAGMVVAEMPAAGAESAAEGDLAVPTKQDTQASAAAALFDWVRRNGGHPGEVDLVIGSAGSRGVLTRVPILQGGVVARVSEVYFAM